MIYFIVAESKYDVFTQRMCVIFLMTCAVLFHCIFLESCYICIISFIWIWYFENGVRQIKGLNSFTLHFKIIRIRLALLKDMLGVGWCYCVEIFLFHSYDKAILTRVCCMPNIIALPLCRSYTYCSIIVILGFWR